MQNAFLMGMEGGKTSGVPYSPPAGSERMETRGLGEQGDGEISAKLLIRRANSTNVIPEEAGIP
ncbi:MAG: hypothetical protein ABS69_15915 [Nitrosomonadales bacterium SCN 54-20]|nr:MAG: hypothetical protein ABS69_15915 [Nitrosomonadales bacterium SCN 54-20]